MRTLESMAHPALKEYAGQLGRVSERSEQGIFAQYPELATALVLQLPGLISRDLMFAHNVFGGSGEVYNLLKTEGKEIRETVAVTLKRGELVNGEISVEGADYLVFGGLWAAMGEMEDKELPAEKMGAVVLGLLGMRAMRRVWLGFDHVAALPETVRKNWKNNYPEKPLKAPADWDVKRMTDYYLTVMKPALRGLRNVFPDGKLPVEVADSLNELRESPPTQFAWRPGFAAAYLQVLENILVK